MWRRAPTSYRWAHSRPPHQSYKRVGCCLTNGAISKTGPPLAQPTKTKALKRITYGYSDLELFSSKFRPFTWPGTLLPDEPNFFGPGTATIRITRENTLRQAVRPSGPAWESGPILARWRKKRATISRNPLIFLVPRHGIEPRTRGFSVPCSTN